MDGKTVKSKETERIQRRFGQAKNAGHSFDELNTKTVGSRLSIQESHRAIFRTNTANQSGLYALR